MIAQTVSINTYANNLFKFHNIAENGRIVFQSTSMNMLELEFDLHQQITILKIVPILFSIFLKIN
jgi:hypothetical protein